MRASLHDLQRAEHAEQQRDQGTLRARYTPLDVNFFGTYRVTQAFLSLLIRSRGVIVNNVSLMALAPRRSLRPIFDGAENQGKKTSSSIRCQRSRPRAGAAARPRRSSARTRR